MNTAILKGAAEHGGPIALSASVAALTVALVSSSHSPVTAAASPSPTVTVTAPAPVAAPPSRRPSSPSMPQPAATVRSVSDRTGAMPHTGSGSQSPAPSPSAAAPCGGRVLSVRALSDRACLSIGR